MSNPQPPYGQQPPAPWSPYPGSAPASGYPQQGGYPQQPQQGGYAPPSNYPPAEAYPPQQPGMYAPPSGYGQQPGMYAPPSGYGQQPGMYAPNSYAPPPPPAPAQSSRNNALAGAFAAVGGLAAVIGFVAIPYYTISGSNGFGGSQSVHYSAHLFANAKSSNGAGYTELWGVLIGAGLLALIGASLMRAWQASAARSLAISLLVIGVVDLGILFRVFSDFNSKVNDLTGGQTTAGVSYGFGIGFWLTVAGVILAMIGGGIALTRTNH